MLSTSRANACAAASCSRPACGVACRARVAPLAGWRQNKQLVQAEPEEKPSIEIGQRYLMQSHTTEEGWREMDKKVNKYPSQRIFTAIGTGGDDFKASMLQAVVAVVGSVHQECLSDRPSSGGKYISVKIGPVWVENPDQVIAVFANMRTDSRLKWYM